MGINQFFQETLGANLKNPRWSWGAIDPITNRVFLRLWNDQIDQDSNGQRVQVYWKNSTRHSNGLIERLEHINAIKSGAQGIGVVCQAANPKSDEVRTIENFRRSPLLILDGFIEDDNFIYAYIKTDIPIDKLSRYRTGQSTLTKDLKTIITSKKLDATERESLVNARVGQGEFRLAVLQLWNHRCSVTGSSTQDAIRASHIKPWRDSSNSERLDPYNGLPLVANLDALFDAGIISFNRHGKILVSDILNKKEQEIYGVVGKTLTREPPKDTANYLHYHRTNIYRG